MDRKTVIILAVCFGLFLLWPKLIDRMLPPTKKPPSTNTVAGATNTAGPTNPMAGTPAAATNQPSLAKPADFNVAAEATDAPVVLETEDARYTFTTIGGGLKQIELIRFRETVGRAAWMPPSR